MQTDDGVYFGHMLDTARQLAAMLDGSTRAAFDEDLSDRALRVLRGGYSIHAPDFLLLEMDSIFCKRIRRGDITRADGDDARRILRQLPIEQHAFTAYRDTAYEIASLTGQSVYYCLYVALAAIIKGKMATADRRFYDALQNGTFKKHLVWIGDIK